MSVRYSWAIGHTLVVGKCILKKILKSFIAAVSCDALGISKFCYGIIMSV